MENASLCNKTLLRCGLRWRLLEYRLVRDVAKIEDAAARHLGRGDTRAALTELMNGYGEDILRHCRSMLGDDALAADVRQTVFVQAFRDLRRFGGRASFRTWLFVIARHRCLDALRGRRRWRRRFESVALPPDVDAGDDSVEDALDRSGQAARLAAAVAELKPVVRAAVLLRYQEGLSYAEMAEVCGEAAATLQARVSRALPTLRRALEKAGAARGVRALEVAQ